MQELYNYLGHTYNVLHNVVIHSLSCVVCALVLLAVYGLCCVVWVVLCKLCCVGCVAWSLLCGLLAVCEGCVWVFVCGLLVVWVVVCGLCDINVCCVWCKIDNVMLVEVSLYLESTVYTIHSLNVVSLCIMLYILKTIKQEKVIVISTTSLLCTTHTHTLTDYLKFTLNYTKIASRKLVTMPGKKVNHSPPWVFRCGLGLTSGVLKKVRDLTGAR